MPIEYIPIFIFAAVVALVPVVAFALARRAGRANRPSDAESTEPRPLAFEETERRGNSSQIFLAAALFVICDAGVVLLALWAVRVGDLGLFGLIAVAAFSCVLACGYVWLYRNRVLERL